MLQEENFQPVSATSDAIDATRNGSVNVPWTEAVSLSEGLRRVCTPGQIEVLRAYVFLRLGKRSPREKETLCHDAIVKLWDKPEDLKASFHDSRSLAEYVAQTAIHLHLDEQRERKREPARRQREEVRQQRLESERQRFKLDPELRRKLNDVARMARQVIERRHWNALLTRIDARWHLVEIEEPFTAWQGIEPALNQATHRSDINRARQQFRTLFSSEVHDEQERDTIERIISADPRSKDFCPPYQGLNQ
jgi:hypothetical protein